MAADIAWACKPKSAIAMTLYDAVDAWLLDGLSWRIRVSFTAQGCLAYCSKVCRISKWVELARLTVCRCGRQPLKPQPHARTQSQASRRWVLAFMHDQLDVSCVKGRTASVGSWSTLHVVHALLHVVHALLLDF